MIVKPKYNELVRIWTELSPKFLPELRYSEANLT